MKNQITRKLIIFLCLFLSGFAFGNEMKINVATWNHMCQGDAFADEWGTPEETILCMEKYKLSSPDQITDTQKLEANTARYKR